MPVPNQFVLIFIRKPLKYLEKSKAHLLKKKFVKFWNYLIICSSLSVPSNFKFLKIQQRIDGEIGSHVGNRTPETRQDQWETSRFRKSYSIGETETRKRIRVIEATDRLIARSDEYFTEVTGKMNSLDKYRFRNIQFLNRERIKLTVKTVCGI